MAAAVGLARTRLSSPLTREQLHGAHSVYLPDPPPLPEEADRAWEWAACRRSGLADLLVPSDHEGRRWRAFDYLNTQRPLPNAVWHAALDMTTDQDHFTIGVTVHRAERADITETAWRPLAKQGNTDAMFNLGILLQDITQEGRTGTMFFLGGLLWNTGRRVEEAEHWYRQDSQHGNTLAIFHSNLLLEESNRRKECEARRQRAGEGRDAE